LYLLFAVYAWIDFANTNHDGLADVGLYLITLPVALVGTLLLGNDLTPNGYGYLTANAIYYVPAVVVTAALLGIIAHLVGRVVRTEFR
jgi:hypothetical protein